MSHTLFLRIITVLLFGASTTAFAAAGTPIVDPAAVAKYQQRAQISVARAAQNKAARGASLSWQPDAEIFINASRAYPPSCLESPIQFGLWQNDPNYQQTQILLGGDPLSGDSSEQAYSETVTLTLFRVVCSSGMSASLLEVDRASGMEGNFTSYPTFPGITINQGSLSDFVLRMADDPNTYFSTTYAVTPLINSDVFVLELYYGDSAPDYNQAYTLVVDNLLGSGFAQTATFTVGNYNTAQYSEASLPLKINGYLTGTWTNPNQGGEGIFLQVYDVDGVNRTMAFAWFTYDPLGLPFWLYGQTANPFPIGNRTMTATTAYLTGGGFGAPPSGAPGPAVTTWGTVSFSFPDCNTMTITYTGNADAVNGPTGAGTKTFTRVGSINSLACQ